MHTRPPHVMPSEHGDVGDVYLARQEIASRVVELGAEIAADYDGLDPLLIAPLKSSVVFLADLTRALPVPHTLDVIELAPYTGAVGGSASGGAASGGVRLLKDVDVPLRDRHVLLVEDVVDTGLTLHFLCKTLSLRDPASLAAVTLLDRPYRRLVEKLPLRYVGFTCSRRALRRLRTRAGRALACAPRSPSRCRDRAPAAATDAA